MDKPEFCGTYHLERLDGELAPTKATLNLRKESEDFEVIAKVASTLRGHVKFGEGKLSGELESTMVAGSDEQVRIEESLVKGFGTGLAVHWSEDTLTLEGESGSFVFCRDLTAERLVGRYALSKFNGAPAANDNIELVVVPSTGECISVIAQFTNSLRGELRLQDGILQGSIASTTHDSEGVMKEMEEMFDAGMGGGMQVSVDGKILTLANDHSVFSYLRSLLPSDLVGDYVLKSLHGSPVQSDGQITLSFSQGLSGDDVGVTAKASNALEGRAQLVKDTLQGELVSPGTKGSEAEMLVEDALTSGLSAGFLCTLEGGRLTLRCGDNTLVYGKAASMPYENGKPTYFGEDVAPCFNCHGNGLMFRIINADERKWAFYNDTKGYNMRAVVTFGTRSRIKALGETHVDVNEEGRQVAEVSVPPGATVMFITGYVNGYKCLYDALPV